MLVFDASTLILITKIELLDLLLGNLNMAVAIPDAVERECCGGAKTLDALMIQKALRESRILVKSVRNQGLITRLEADFNMGRGESEVIALALEEKALLVGIDDKRGINACKLTGIPFTTAIDILVRSRHRGLIERNDAFARLSLLAKYGRYKAEVLDDAKLRLEEQP